MHNGYELERVFGIKEPKSPTNAFYCNYIRALSRFHPNCLVTADSLKYNEMFISNSKRYLDGYWQDERYFKDVEEQVREAFVFQKIDEKNQYLAKEMVDGNSVSLHVRRGDYASFGMSMMGEEYYRNAVDYIMSCVETPHFYIFSDDVIAAEAMGEKIGVDYTLINHNKGQESYKDMYLMSQCKHNIIANSSFSWWGAWLNMNREQIVIAPIVWDVKREGFHPQVTEWILL